MGTSPAQGKPNAMAQQPLCRACWLGQDVEYQAAWDLQRRLAAERAAGTCADTLLLLEHAPVYTAGRRAPPEHVRLDADGLRRLGVPLIETDRGGQVAYHGPGQLVGYPILELRDHGMGPTPVRTSPGAGAGGDVGRVRHPRPHRRGAHGRMGVHGEGCRHRGQAQPGRDAPRLFA